MEGGDDVSDNLRDEVIGLGDRPAHQPSAQGDGDPGVAHTESEPFPVFLRSCTDLELVGLQHDARRAGDTVTLDAALAELARRAKATAAGDDFPAHETIGDM